MLGFNGGIIGIANTVFTGTKSDDPNYSDVSLLLNGNGTNGSTTFKDSSSHNHSITATGNAQISDAQSKFGGSSMYFDGNGDYLSIPDDTSFHLGSDNFTFEFWTYLNSTTGHFINKRVSNNFQYLYLRLTSGSLILWATSNGSSWDIANNFGFGNTALSTGQWYHIALVRNGTKISAYVDGTESPNTITTSAAIQNGSTNPLRIAGDVPLNGYLNGYIDDFRITKGVARYTSNFTPPTAQLPDGETGTFASGLWTSSDYIKQIRNELWPGLILPFVTDGLVLNLDAGNSDSYSGSGTTWTDLSGQGNNATLTDGPTYNSADGGYIEFDGTDDYGYSPSFTSDNRTYTIEVWFKTSTASGKSFIAVNNSTTGSVSNYDRMIYIGTDGKLRFGHYDGSVEVTTDTITTNDNNWHHAVGTWDGGNLKLYRDNNLVSTNSGANASTDNGTRYWIIAGRRNAGWPSGSSSSVHYTPVDISVARIYWGKSLTASEVTQNFDALKGRYGL